MKSYSFLDDSYIIQLHLNIMLFVPLNIYLQNMWQHKAVMSFDLFIYKTHTCFSLRHSSSPPQYQRQLTIGWRCRPSRQSHCHLAEHWWTECPEDTETDGQTDKLFIKAPMPVLWIIPGIK